MSVNVNIRISEKGYRSGRLLARKDVIKFRKRFLDLEDCPRLRIEKKSVHNCS